MIRKFQGDSTNIKSLTHESDSKNLIVEFKNGGKYVYKNVPLKIFGELVLSESIGKYFHKNIKKGLYEFEKV